jgi:ribosomal protein L7Ae-like RNA K-turn-binding protein
LTVKLLLKLKELYFKRKLKQPKGRKQLRPPKKRYIIGLNEVTKHLQAGNLTMVILATNLEKVEDDHGTDSVILRISEMCRKMKVPLVYSMSRYRLGCATKYKG